MPEMLENIRKSVWEKIKGKTNPRTNKPYTEEDSWAIATAQYKKKYGSRQSVSLEPAKDEPSLVMKALIEMGCPYGADG